MFAGLTSRWTMLAAWAAASARPIWIPSARSSASARAARREPLLERRPGDALHHEVRRVGGEIDVEHLDDARVRERRDRAGLLAEPLVEDARREPVGAGP